MKTKKLLSVFLAAVMLCGLFIPSLALSQTVPDEYTEIFTAEDLYNIRNDLAGKYILMNDIDLSVYENWEPIGTSDTPFTGELDGNGKSILNLTIKESTGYSEKDYYALFAKIDSGSVTDLSLINVAINLQNTDYYTGSISVGSLAGTAVSSTVENCVVTGKININGFNSGNVGGLSGREYMTIPSGCINYSDISVSADWFKEICIGGIAGTSFLIENCCNYGNISTYSKDSNKETNKVFIGGICGNSHKFGNLIRDCYNRGSVSVDFSTPSTLIGGLIGDAYFIKNSYNSGDIVLPENFGGNYGAVAGNINTNLLAIYQPGFETKNVYYINEDIIPACANYYVPEDFSIDPFDEIHFLTEEEFKKQESFVGFDFDTVWEMAENGYPVFKNQPKVVAKKHNITLEAGKSCSLGIANPVWETSDPNVVLMTEDGVIMAQSPGEAVLSVEYPYGYITEYYVTVTESDFVDTPTPDPDPENKVESAEIVCLPLKNRIVFGYGSPNTPEGIVLKLKYKDGTEKTETVTRTDNGYFAGEERIFGGFHLTVVDFGIHTETLYINDESVSVEYDYFVIPPILHMIIYLLRGELFVIA